MAVTIAIFANQVDDTAYVTVADITGPASYTTGGEVLTAAQVNQLLPKLGGSAVLADTAKIQFFQSESNTTGQNIVLDRANSKLMYFAGAQVSAATNLSGGTVRVRIFYGQANLG